MVNIGGLIGSGSTVTVFELAASTAVANTSNPVKAAVRDLLFRFKLTPKPKFPILVDGVLAFDSRGKPMHEAGSVVAQGRVFSGLRTCRFDEHVGFSFALVCRHGVVQSIGAFTRAELEAIGMQFIELVDAAPGHSREVVDVDGVYGRELDRLHSDAMLLRPDFVLYGHAPQATLGELLEGFLASLRDGKPSRGGPAAQASRDAAHH